MAACLLTTWISLFVVVVVGVPSAVVPGQKNITAHSGQDVTFPCRAPNNKAIHVKWSRTDLGEEYALLYRDDRIDLGNQHQSFQNRVDLQDRRMKDGDVSLILKNVMTTDAGTYECKVLVGKEMRLSNTIRLTVDPPAQTGGGTKDGGKEVEEKEAGGKEEKLYLRIAGPSVAAVLFAVGFFLIYRKCKAQQKQGSYEPPTELQPV
ncbi:versican core protein-like [Simochromis diagramma]|uniref:versican core protein-like n=1 Tax=Simochromis diagramma TaxID=43689 RepID=UPI001A7EB086|nr:versican core protein-like [Simochromis diagramma]XP_039892325.1 versican core protein-like [Simochromis diagramma]